MPYLTPSDLLTRFGAEELAQVADRATPRLVSAELLEAAAGAADMTGWSEADVEAVGKAMATILQAIADADSAIDGYVAGRYGAPMPTPPAVVKRLAGDIARYYLHDDHATEAIQKRYDAAIALLRDVAAGKVNLGPEAASATPAGGGTVEMVSSARVFGRGERGL